MTATTTLPVLFSTGIHSARPAASAVGPGGLYSCTTHSLVYQTDGSSWTTWANLAGTGGTGTLTTIEEADGSPTDSAVTKLVMPNGTLAIVGHVATYTPAVAPTASEAFLSGDVTMTSADTFYDGPSISLGAGTYIIMGGLTLKETGQNSFFTVKLWDGTNVYHAPGGQYNDTQGGDYNVSVFAKVTLVGTVTVKISAACHNTGGVILATAIFNGTSNKASKIVALQIA